MRKPLVLLCLTGLLYANISLANTPTETARDYFKAFQQGDYQAVAAMYDPAALQSFRDMMGFIAELDLGDGGETLSVLFGPGANAESVKAMSNTDFFARFFENVLAQAQLMGELSFDNMQILGEVKEGADMVHVLSRSKASVGEMEIEAMEVISFKKVGANWKVMLSGEVKGMASQMRQMIGVQ